MSESWIDPGRLEGDALKQWYLKSPADAERERQEAAARRYQDFFYGGAGNDSDPRFGGDLPASGRGINPRFGSAAHTGNIDPGFPAPAATRDIDPRFGWIATGPDRFRDVRMMTADGQSAGPSLPATSFDNRASTDRGLRSNVSHRPPANAPPINNGVRSAGAQPSQKPPIDPPKTPVFQVGPDGKLHPIGGWRTTGPFDFGTWSHNIRWGGVAKDLAEIGAGVTTFFSGVGLGGELLSALGPDAEAAVAEGIAESQAAKASTQATHSHHVDPKYMGGAADGERVDLVGELHRRFHSMLGKAHREAGFPPVGGKSGSAVKWDEHFELNPGSREEAYEILRRVAREFDDLYGTNISSKLPGASGSTGVGPPPPK